ncbi:recombinase family protein [Paenibacillus anaericanus]|uniref:Recombinase family protein n=1 Tax=Paenibacillus anaericanus TaxID=170367 RepID=A0A3S1BKD0_9BACL|nr:recombinase family protein [Paenibacillus anaericanus]RUT43267.1 recombinase family protein [Paenibacillus anaericanus]
MIYGYARVSSVGQNLDVQFKQLQDYGCGKIFKEKVSGRTRERKELQAMLASASEGDTIVVPKLDRLARSTRDALTIIDDLNKRKIALVILNMGGDVVNTATAIGKLLITVLSGIAEFEADMTKERQTEGIAEAKLRGVYKGRPKKYTGKHSGLNHAIDLFVNRNTNKYTVKQICEITKIGRSTLYRELQERGLQEAVI